MKHLRGQVVSTINLSQALFAGVAAFFLLGEVPEPIFYPACVLMGLGATLTLRGEPTPSPSRTNDERKPSP
jgi:drug/metabolite transporter (DMT)-like permease